MTETRHTTLRYQCIFVGALLISSCIHTRSESATTVTQFSSKLNKYLFASADDASKGPVTTLVWSPLSVYSALSILLEGAGGKTEKELRDFLEPSLKNDVNFTGAHNKSSSSSYGLNIATGLFISDQFKLSKVFSEKISTRQTQPDVVGNLNISRLDFSQLEKSVIEVNKWVNKTTDGLISEIVRSEQLAADAKLVLVNAVQFKGTWRSQFNPANTDSRIFYGVDKNSTVDMMFQRSTQDYAKFYDEDGQTFEMLKLGYIHSDTKLVFIIPENSSFLPTLFSHLTSKGTKISQLIERLEPTELDIYIPKFKIESEVPIKSALQQAGLTSIFSQGECNLTGLVDATETNISVPLYLSDLVHKTVVNVDEDGTEAGAATASFLVPLSGLIEHRIQNLTLNKPFILFIRQAHSSIFQGIVANLPDKSMPSSSGVSSDSSTSNTNQTAKESSSNDPPKNVEGPEITNSTKRDEKSPESSWWVPNGNPEYMQNNIEARTQVISPQDKLSSTKSAPKDRPAYRFQQPEPTNPEGIRFQVSRLNYSKDGNSN